MLGLTLIGQRDRFHLGEPPAKRQRRLHCRSYAPLPGFIGFRQQETGLTLIELMVIVAIISTLAAIAIPTYAIYIEKTKTARAISEIHTLQMEIMALEQPGYTPKDLSAINRAGYLDPWGNPYQYQSLEDVPKGMWRKDRFLVPLNSTFDLWSMGPDGKSSPPLTAKSSHDDIIRANDGSYIGRGDRY